MQTNLAAFSNRRWQPGNGTSYDLCLIEHPMSRDALLFTWVNGPTGTGRCMAIPTTSALSLGYLMEKMGVGESDGDALIGWLLTTGAVRILHREGRRPVPPDIDVPLALHPIHVPQAVPPHVVQDVFSAQRSVADAARDLVDDPNNTRDGRGPVGVSAGVFDALAGAVKGWRKATQAFLEYAGNPDRT